MAVTDPEVLGTPPQPGGSIVEGFEEVRAEFVSRSVGLISAAARRP